MTALVTGGRGGIGQAIVRAHGDAVALDLPEFDVGSQEAWASLEGEFDAAFLNAGIGIGYPDVSELPDDEIARIVDANFLGVVYGARECARRLMPNGGSIVCTASLAGLTGMPFDPMYTATKHAVVGFVRGAAPALARRGIRLNALCPGFTDTPIVVDELRDTVGELLMEPSFVAEAAMQALHSEDVGQAWVVQPNRVLQFRFPNIPGPR